MKACTLTQPYASLSVVTPPTRRKPLKEWETRSPNFPLKPGAEPIRVVICAGKGDAGERAHMVEPQSHRFKNPLGWALEQIRHSTRDPWYKKWDGDHEVAPDKSKRPMLPLGVALGVVTFAHVLTSEDFGICGFLRADPVNSALGNYSLGRIAIQMVDVQPLRRPIPVRGMLGLWTVPDDIMGVLQEENPHINLTWP